MIVTYFFLEEYDFCKKNVAPGLTTGETLYLLRYVPHNVVTYSAAELFVCTVTSTEQCASVVRWVEGSGSLCLCFRLGAHALCWSGEITPRREGK